MTTAPAIHTSISLDFLDRDEQQAFRTIAVEAWVGSDSRPAIMLSGYVTPRAQDLGWTVELEEEAFALGDNAGWLTSVACSLNPRPESAHLLLFYRAEFREGAEDRKVLAAIVDDVILTLGLDADDVVTVVAADVLDADDADTRGQRARGEFAAADDWAAAFVRPPSLAPMTNEMEEK